MIKYIVHPSLQNPDHKDYRKAYWASLLLSIITLFVILYSIFFLFYDPNDTTKQITNLLGIVFLVVIMFQLKKSKNITLLMTQLAVCGLIPTMVSVYNTGGIFSVDIVWLFISVFSAYLVIGITTGNIISALCVIYITVLFYLDKIGLKTSFKEYIITHDSTHNAITLIFVLIVTSVILIAFVRSLDKANKTIEEIKQAQIEKLEESLKEKTDELYPPDELHIVMFRDIVYHIGVDVVG